MSPTRRVQILSKSQKRIQYQLTVDELYAPAFVSPDEMGDGVDDIDTIFDWYHLIT